MSINATVKEEEPKLKIFLIMGLGYVIGKLQHDWKLKYVIKNAGMVRVQQGKTIISEPLLPWMKNYLEKIQNFEIPRELVIVYDDVMPGLDQAYEEYSRRLEAKISGLYTPNSKEVNKLGQ